MSLVGALGQPRSKRPPSMWISRSPSGPPATTMLIFRSLAAAGGSGISSRNPSTAPNQSSDRNTCAITPPLSQPGILLLSGSLQYPGRPEPAPQRGCRAPPPAADESQAQTREALIEAASRLFDARGFAATSIADIAAGYTTGALYSNFAGKEDLFLDVLARQLTDEISALGAALSAEPTVGGRLRAVGRWYAPQAGPRPAHPGGGRAQAAQAPVQQRAGDARLATSAG